MTDYLAVLAVAVAVTLTGAAAAADKPAATSAPVTVTAAALPRYTQAAAGSSLTFSFVQAGANSKGSFKQFATELAYDDKNLAASTLNVKVQVGSVDTQDKDRDSTLAGADLFDTAKFPAAQYVATSLARRADGKLEAVGKLTLRGVTRELRLPLTLRATATGFELSGDAAIKRLDYGVGQGEWHSTEWVGDEVRLQYKVPLVKAASAK